MEWVPEVKKSFEDIKVMISTVLILLSPNHNLPFKIYSIVSKHSCTGVLTQKKKEDKRPIAFMSFPLRNIELNYSNLNK